MFCQNGRINKNYPNAELKESNSVDISRLEMRKRVLQTHPDTQVGHFVPDTVGGTWFWGLLDWGFLGDKYNLTPACNKHDICYSTCGKTQKQCDVQFKKDIYDICRSGGGEHSEYLYYANKYELGVRKLGKGSYQDVQKDMGCIPCTSPPPPFPDIPLHLRGP